MEKGQVRGTTVDMAMHESSDFKSCGGYFNGHQERSMSNTGMNFS